MMMSLPVGPTLQTTSAATLSSVTAAMTHLTSCVLRSRWRSVICPVRTMFSLSRIEKLSSSSYSLACRVITYFSERINSRIRAMDGCCMNYCSAAPIARKRRLYFDECGATECAATECAATSSILRSTGVSSISANHQCNRQKLILCMYIQ